MRHALKKTCALPLLAGLGLLGACAGEPEPTGTDALAEAVPILLAQLDPVDMVHSRSEKFTNSAVMFGAAFVDDPAFKEKWNEAAVEKQIDTAFVAYDDAVRKSIFQTLADELGEERIAALYRDAQNEERVNSAQCALGSANEELELDWKKCGTDAFDDPDYDDRYRTFAKALRNAIDNPVAFAAMGRAACDVLDIFSAEAEAANDMLSVDGLSLNGEDGKKITCPDFRKMAVAELGEADAAPGKAGAEGTAKEGDE